MLLFAHCLNATKTRKTRRPATRTAEAILEYLEGRRTPATVQDIYWAAEGTVNAERALHAFEMYDGSKTTRKNRIWRGKACHIRGAISQLLRAGKIEQIGKGRGRLFMAA